ncbi:MAG: glycosyltransferase family 9 protein [Bryobacterales bacterium]|nr:glycosyltransferase family 9 protein [Bryobacterales bacterium]
MMSTAGKPSPGKSGPAILAVRMGSMGDVIHALPAVATLKHSFPGCSLTWLIDSRWACLLEGNPFVDTVLDLERSTLAGIRRAWRRLRAQRYRFAVDFQGLLKSALAASMARADRIYGFHQSQAREPLAALFYSNRVRTRSAHVVDRNLELAAAAGASSAVRAFPLPEGSPEGSLPEGDFVLANPLGGWPGKQWPLDCYAELAGLLRRRLGLPLVLNGPPQAATRLREVEGALVHVSGLPGLIHATRRAAAVVGIDSGPMHLASALEKPGVAVFGPTDPSRNGPYCASIGVLRDPGAETSYKRTPDIAPSMRAVRPGTVVDCLLERLAGHRRSTGLTA